MRKCFQAAKNETALDLYQASTHVARYWHVTLAMCACAWLTANRRSRPPPAACRVLRPPARR
jgi:hypothetical protein